MDSLFYEKNGLIVSNQPEWLQCKFLVLAGPFECLRLNINMKKTVGMIFQPFRIYVRLSDAVYKRRIVGKVQS